MIALYFVKQNQCIKNVYENTTNIAIETKEIKFHTP